MARRKVFGRVVEQPEPSQTPWERYCANLGLDPVEATVPDGFSAEVTTTCRQCRAEMPGQFRRCVQCGGDWP